MNNREMTFEININSDNYMFLKIKTDSFVMAINEFLRIFYSSVSSMKTYFQDFININICYVLKGIINLLFLVIVFGKMPIRDDFCCG
jgi:hypothetical protein